MITPLLYDKIKRVYPLVVFIMTILFLLNGFMNISVIIVNALFFSIIMFFYYRLLKIFFAPNKNEPFFKKRND